jgi:pyruvate,water dikinase
LAQRHQRRSVIASVRSSATAEVLPDAGFAGQQETFSVYRARAIFYMVVPPSGKMVNSEKSGVMFSYHPSTGEPEVIIEAAWGPKMPQNRPLRLWPTPSASSGSST